MSKFVATNRIYVEFLRTVLGENQDWQQRLFVMLAGKGYKPDYVNDRTVGDVKNEPDGAGYFRQEIVSVRTQETEGGILLTGDDVTFRAEGGQWEAQRWVVYVANPQQSLVAGGLLAEDGRQITVTDGNELIIRIAESGLVLMS